MKPQITKSTLAVGTPIGRYVIREVLGIGGFGITYKAWDPQLKRLVAIKEYLPAESAVRANNTRRVHAHESQIDEYQFGLERFLKEAEILAKFPHPNIVGVFDYYQKNNTAYLIMNFEQGQTLNQYLKAQGARLEEGELKALIKPILMGLQHIHKQDYYHRDIKPSNIYLRDRGEPLLIDFGAARQALGTRSRSLTSIVSPGYAPAEQYGTDLKKQGPWSDLYALGATLYRCISGKEPVDAPTRSSALVEEEGDPLIPAVILGQGRYTPDLLELIDWMLQPSIRRRPQTVNSVLKKLDKNSNTAEIRSTAPTAPVEEARSTAPTVVASEPSEGPPSQTQVSIKPEQAILPDIVSSKLSQAKSKRLTKYSETDPQKSRSTKLIAGTVVLALLVAVGITQQQPLRHFIDQFTRPEEQQGVSGTNSKNILTASADAEALAQSRAQLELEKTRLEGENARREILARQQKKDAQRQQERIRQQTVEKLLTEAAKDIQQLRLSNPVGNNALEKYRKILQLDPQNQDAQQGLNTIVTKYLALVQNSQDNEGYPEAINYLNKAKSILPNYPALQQVEKNLEVVKQAYQREQQRLAEIEKQKLAKEQAKKRQTDPYTGMKFVAIDPGCYQMGGQSNISRLTRVHRVCLNRAYYLGKYEVTQAQWQQVMGDNPSRFKSSNNPVENVSWGDVQTFIRTLNRQTGRNYRLPTEAEWEYACRSGGKDQRYCGSNRINSIAWYVDNSANSTHSVGQKEPNGLGLYDMSGNVWEWVQDWYERYYYSNSPINDPQGPSGGSFRVIRGGSWKDLAGVCRSVDRYGDGPGGDDDLGFRLARTR